MRLIIVLLTTAILQVSASTYGQNITLKQNNASLVSLFTEIRKQTGYDFFYSDKMMDSAKPISIDLKNATIEEALKQIFAKQPLEYELKANSVLIRPKEPSFLDKLAAAIAGDDGKFADIRGVVRNERGEALEGITVTVKGAKTGTSTNAKGEFVLKGVKKGDVLVFTGVAIEPFEYTVKDDKSIDLNLKARLVQLEEVGINTGYQKISKERFVGSYSQLDSAAYSRRAGMGILERLDGTVPGVLFDKKVSSSEKLQIRGISSLNNGSTPLIIVDNFPYPYDLETINQNEVESIVILKDAAAASIWGSRAGNGVIVITTKKAKYNQPLKISANSNIILQEKPRLKVAPAIGSADYIELEKFLFEKGYFDTKLSDTYNRPAVTPVVEILDRIKRGMLDESVGLAEIEKMKSFDVRDELLKYAYKPQLNQQHNMSISGGGQYVNYSFSLGYNKTGSPIKNGQNKNQYTINSSASFKPIKNLEITTAIMLSQDEDRLTTSFPQLPSYPYLRLADDNGIAEAVPKDLRMGYIDTAGNGQLLDWQYRPLDEVHLLNKINELKLINLNIGVSYQLTKWLNAQLNGQYVSAIGGTKNLNSQETFYSRDQINRLTNLNASDPRLRNPIPLGGILEMSKNSSISKNIRGQLNLNHTWGSSHLLQGMFMGELSETNSSGSFYGYYGYNPEIGSFVSGLDYLNTYYPMYINGGSTGLSSLSAIVPDKINRAVSMAANISYSYNGKYTFYGSARRDGANIFGVFTNNKWKPLWSVGVSWSIDKENYFNLDWLSSLALKATYGYLGNSVTSVNGFSTIRYGNGPNPFTRLTTAEVSAPPNPNLKWEEVRHGNLGIDFVSKNNRISGSFQVFRKVSKDLINEAPIPYYIGTQSGSLALNTASLLGKGWELSLKADVIRSPLNWSLGLNFSHAKVKVTDVYVQPFLRTTEQFIDIAINPSIGGLAYALYSYKWSGLDPDTGDPVGVLNGSASKNYLAISKEIPENQIYHGSSVPLYYGNILNTFNWNRFSASFNIGFKLDYYYRKPSLSYSALFQGNSPEHWFEFRNRWEKPGDEKLTNIPSMVYPIPIGTAGGRDSFYQNSQLHVLRGDHIKLQDFRLQYTPTFKQGTFIKQLNVFAYCNNLNIILWRKNKSVFDPETQSGLPTLRTLAFGFNLGI